MRIAPLQPCPDSTADNPSTRQISWQSVGPSAARPTAATAAASASAAAAGVGGSTNLPNGTQATWPDAPHTVGSAPTQPPPQNPAETSRVAWGEAEEAGDWGEAWHTVPVDGSNAAWAPEVDASTHPGQYRAFSGSTEGAFDGAAQGLGAVGAGADTSWHEPSTEWRGSGLRGEHSRFAGDVYGQEGAGPGMEGGLPSPPSDITLISPRDAVGAAWAAGSLVCRKALAIIGGREHGALELVWVGRGCLRVLCLVQHHAGLLHPLCVVVGAAGPGPAARTQRGAGAVLPTEDHVRVSGGARQGS